MSALGIPNSDMLFYPTILGALLVGIGLALLIERVRGSGGLGLLGAVTINLAGGIVLAYWLLSTTLALPFRGRLILWAIVLILVGIRSFELSAHASLGSRRDHTR